MTSRREFLQGALALGGAAGWGGRAQKRRIGPIGPIGPIGLIGPATQPSPARGKRRVFVAGFSHETNTFHPVKTPSFSFAEVSRSPLPVRKDAELTIIPGIHARPNGGGAIEEKPCREAMNRVLDSLRAAVP